MRLILSAVFVVVSLPMAAPVLAADTLGKTAPASRAAEPPRKVPCIFSPQELAPIFGNSFNPGVHSQGDPGVESCTYQVTSGDDSVVITVDRNNSPERFARQRKTQTMRRSEAHNIFGVGDGGYSNGSLYAVLRGNTSIEIKGFRTAAARKVQYEEGIELLRLAVDRIP